MSALTDWYLLEMYARKWFLCLVWNVRFIICKYLNMICNKYLRELSLWCLCIVLKEKYSAILPWSPLIKSLWNGTDRGRLWDIYKFEKDEAMTWISAEQDCNLPLKQNPCRQDFLLFILLFFLLLREVSTTATHTQQVLQQMCYIFRLQ